ncbi:MAG: 4-(cytidine 5'-diphospho)-2-C-methyl-D-erythritol kinase [Chloroflexi bacterium]|nr:4-(cytidine 5'-diphospho)-2-C-methyl-D-erythritol kinase [Chloroflexota bacterium]
MIRVLAPAKINLTLEVLSRRPDGYHEICSVVQAVGLYDELTFEGAEDITLTCEGLDLPPEDNLVVKSARLLGRQTGAAVGARITLRKGIPVGAGLGGGSSDAAATLTALNELWQLGLSRERLAALAAGVGSDVPFFIYGGTALVRGKGETVTPLGPVSPAWVVLLDSLLNVPAGKTAIMYKSLTATDFTDGHYTVRMVQEIREEKRIDEDLLFNVFDRVATVLFPDLQTQRSLMQNEGNGKVTLAGSGPVLCSVLSQETDARNLYGKLLSRGIKVYLAKTLN